MKIAVIGGDKRMLFAARAFMLEGCEVSISGFDGLMSLCNIRIEEAYSAAETADILILPLPPVRGCMVNAPFTSSEIAIEELAQAAGHKPVFSGFAAKIAPYFGGKVYDYSAREEFALRNAVLTAEGALQLILSDYEGSVFGAKILVMGYGRIGKVLAAYLKSLGAEVTVAARKLTDRTLADMSGCVARDYSELELKSYDIVLNTVPAPVGDEAFVNALGENVYIIDLASAPGGIDFDAARRRDLSCIHALSLPGKTAPLAAGKIIKDTIFHIIKEENGGKDYSGLCDDRLLLHL